MNEAEIGQPFRARSPTLLRQSGDVRQDLLGLGIGGLVCCLLCTARVECDEAQDCCEIPLALHCVLLVSTCFHERNIGGFINGRGRLGLASALIFLF